MKKVQKIKKIYQETGIPKLKQIIVHCYRGILIKKLFMSELMNSQWTIQEALITWKKLGVECS